MNKKDAKKIHERLVSDRLILLQEQASAIAEIEAVIARLKETMQLALVPLLPTKKKSRKKRRRK